jgi:ABC-type antimicrobial peptide transport system permease subunit
MADMAIVARTAGDPRAFPARVKSISESLDAKLFPEIRQLKVLYRENISGVEKVAAIVTLIGFVAVSLASVGILSLVAFTISQRSKEIAIRLALGSPAIPALVSVLRQYAWPVVLGGVGGLALAAAFSRLLRFGLYGVSNLDPLSYASAITMLLAIVALAAFLPARRALKLDIARTLHQE